MLGNTANFEHSSMKNFLTVILLITSLSSYGQMKWKSVDDVPKQWITLERDSVGYLIYKPCDGSTARMTIDSTYITVYWQLDAPDKLLIDKFTTGADNKSFYIHATYDNCKIDFNVKIVDIKRKLVLWKFKFNCNNEGGFEEKWLMTSTEFTDKFRLIDNPCGSIKIAEKYFLPIEF